MTQVHQLLGDAIALHKQGHLQQARELYDRVLAIEPSNPLVIQQLGVIALQTGRASQAVELISRAIAIDGEIADWHVNLGAALNALNRPEDAIAAFQRAIALDPQSAVAFSNLAAMVKDVNIEEAIVVGRRSLQLRPDPIAHSNLLLSLNYRLTDPVHLLAEHREWARLYADPLEMQGASKGRSLLAPRRSPLAPGSGRLCIGYLSGDFRNHPTAYFLLPVLAHHDRSRFEIVCIDDTRSPDAMSERFKALSDRWCSIRGQSHEQAAEAIRALEIDILVDLAGHFAGNRLLVFARRPARVQISCIGYPSTTGLSQIDYRLSDAVCDPPPTHSPSSLGEGREEGRSGESSDAHSVERVIRFPDIFWCYQPPENCPEVIDLPADQNGGTITFGCANVFAKITPEALDLWGRILARVPGSRLILQAAAFQMNLPKQTVLRALRLHGVEESRVQFIFRQPMPEHLRTLGGFDIALDTFPFNGGTTTCHSLWMGAPVVTLAGNRHASRMGASIITSIGLGELIARTPDEYVEIASKLAQDRERLREMRRAMRDKMKNSPLMDAPRYTCAIEAVFQEIWNRPR